MDILLISNEDACRSRIAQELLHTFGRGMNISTAGVMEGNCVPDVVCNVMEQNGYGISRKKPSGVGAYAHRSWDYVVTSGIDTFSCFGLLLYGNYLKPYQCIPNNYLRDDWMHCVYCLYVISN